MTTQNNENLVKTSNFFECKKCNYNTCRKYNLILHYNTKKHKTTQNNENLVKTSKTYSCTVCNKIFNDRAGLWRHNKMCLPIEKTQNIILNMTDLHNEDKQQKLIEFLLKENSEFKQLMMEQNKSMIEIAKHSGGHHNINNSNNTNNFNLNFFLNETCKNAMNITDFVNQLPINIEDLEETGRLGFAEGISRIFINGLSKIEVSDRPLHCTDFKREVMYIKDNNEWSKETTDKPLLLQAIKQVSNKNIKQIFEWQKLHPEYIDSESKQSDKYLKIVCEAMPGGTDEECHKNYNKIIKNIIKKTIVDK